MASEVAIRIDNRYEVLGELGRGGMGVVYKANDLKMDRLVAIKVMTSHATGRDEYQERFLREAKSIAKMQQQNIVVVHDYGYHNGAPYMAMEYVEGIPLDKVIASRVNLTPLTKVDYIIQVCHALHYAHERGIVHRDVKPGNIMVLEGGKRVKLLDFGIARAGGVSNLSKSGLAMGTTCYMSPEQTKGQKDLDGRADIFSAGVVLYELLTGKPPWGGDSDYEIMTKIIHDPCPPLSASLRNYPASLDHILELALAKDASARYQTAEKMALELSELESLLKEQALEDALIQFEHGDLLRASDLVSQILRIDTRYREAIELRNKLQQVAQLQQRSEQVRQLRMTAEQAVGQKRFSEALAAVEQAISIDSANSELFHYRELIRHEVKRRDDVRKKLELAKRAQEINDLSTAQELVDKALEADPTDTHARMMKSSLEQEKKRQQEQEIVEDASRALAARAFAQARELIQQLEALDPNSAPLVSLRKALLEGEAEERRRNEIEDLIRDIRPILEAGDVKQCLSITEQALARFPNETRLLRLRAQAEALRDAAERERVIQEQMAAVKKLMEKGQSAEALAVAEGALKRLGTDYRLQTSVVQLRQVVEREREFRAEQAVLARALEAMRTADFESALNVLTSARIDFPNSKEIADALQTVQEAIARKADEVAAANARKREVAETLERALANELDPETQVRLAEEAARRIPGNDAAERVLVRVRERQRQIASAVERAHRFEQARNYAECIREWERVRQLWPQYPQLDKQIARLTAALAPPASPPEHVAAPPAPAPGFSATSIMAAAPKLAPSPRVETAPAPAEKPLQPSPQPEVVRSSAAVSPSKPLPLPDTEAERSRAEPLLRSKKLLLGVAGATAVLMLAVLVYVALRPHPKTVPQPAAESIPKTPAPPPVAPRPAVGTLTIQTNVDQVDVLVDGALKTVTEGRKTTFTVVPGSHTITVQKPGYAASPQPVAIDQDRESTLEFTLNKTEDANQPAPDTYLIVKALSGAKVRIDKKNEGEVAADGSFSIKSIPGRHRIELTLDGFQPWSDTITAKAGDRKQVIAELKAIPKPPPIIAFSSSKASVLQGAAVQLEWDVQNATQVTIDPGIGPVQSKGSTSVNPAEAITYTLTAKGDGGTQTKSVPISVTALPKPTISSFEKGTDKILQGQSVKLFWEAQNAASASISPDVGDVPIKGQHEIKPAKTTTYTLTATGPGGTDTRQVEVIVESAPVATVSQPAPPPAPAAEDPEIKAISETLERYRIAYGSMSIAELRKVWPLMPKDKQKAIEAGYNSPGVKALTVGLKCGKPAISGETAQDSCRQTFSYTISGKLQKPYTNQVTFQLKKNAGVWYVIDTIAGN